AELLADVVLGHEGTAGHDGGGGLGGNGDGVVTGGGLLQPELGAVAVRAGQRVAGRVGDRDTGGGGELDRGGGGADRVRAHDLAGFSGGGGGLGDVEAHAGVARVGQAVDVGQDRVVVGLLGGAGLTAGLQVQVVAEVPDGGLHRGG